MAQAYGLTIFVFNITTHCVHAMRVREALPHAMSHGASMYDIHAPY